MDILVEMKGTDIRAEEEGAKYTIRGEFKRKSTHKEWIGSDTHLVSISV